MGSPLNRCFHSGGATRNLFQAATNKNPRLSITKSALQLLSHSAQFTYLREAAPHIHQSTAYQSLVSSEKFSAAVISILFLLILSFAVPMASSDNESCVELNRSWSVKWSFRARLTLGSQLCSSALHLGDGFGISM